MGHVARTATLQLGTSKFMVSSLTMLAHHAAFSVNFLQPTLAPSSLLTLEAFRVYTDESPGKQAQKGASVER